MPASSINSLILSVATLCWAGTASAATSCVIAAGNVGFGNYDVFDASDRDTEASVMVTCSRAGGPQKIDVNIAIGPGGNGGTTASRKMKSTSGSDVLGYVLFQDVSRTQRWGDIPGVDAFTQKISVPNNSSAQLSTKIYGRIPAGQDVSKGTYTDTVFVTVTP
ncbi:Csu type fimbrial protein [Thermomonas sp.]